MILFFISEQMHIFLNSSFGYQETYSIWHPTLKKALILKRKQKQI